MYISVIGKGTSQWSLSENRPEEDVKVDYGRGPKTGLDLTRHPTLLPKCPNVSEYVYPRVPTTSRRKDVLTDKEPQEPSFYS